MSKTIEELLTESLRESKDFAKMIRYYLFNVSQERPLTSEEQVLYDATHDIHVHTENMLVLLQNNELTVAIVDHEDDFER